MSGSNFQNKRNLLASTQSLKVAKSTDLNDFVKVASELKSMNSQFCHMTQYPIFSRDLLADKLSDTAVLVI